MTNDWVDIVRYELIILQIKQITRESILFVSQTTKMQKDYLLDLNI